MTQYKRNIFLWFVNDSFNSDLKKELKTTEKTDVTKPNFTVSPFIDIKKRKCSRNCSHVVMWRSLILS